MGVLAEFFVATEAEAAKYDGDFAFPDSHKALYKRFTEKGHSKGVLAGNAMNLRRVGVAASRAGDGQ